MVERTVSTTIDLSYLATERIENTLTHDLTATIIASLDDIQIEFSNDILEFDGDDGISHFKLVNDQWEPIVEQNKGYGESGLVSRELDFYITFEPMDELSKSILLDSHNEFSHLEDDIAQQIESAIRGLNHSNLFTEQSTLEGESFQNEWYVSSHNTRF